jgi:hypothetical protein
VHEAGKFASLALAGNPTVSELLWLPDELYEVRTGLGDELIAIRTAFLSAPRVRDAYVGYATDQLRRLLRAGPVGETIRDRQAKHGRHLLRLLDQGFALYATGQLPIRLADPARYLEFGRRVADDPEAAGPVLAAARAKFDSVRSPLPEEPDEAAVERWLLRVRRAQWRDPTAAGAPASAPVPR